MPRPGRRFPRIRNRDGVVMAISAAALLLGSELTNPVLRTLIDQYVGQQQNPVLAAGSIALVFLAYTSAFGSLLALVAAALFAQNEVPRGRFFLGLGVGLSVIGLTSKIALSLLSENLSVVAWLATTATGLGVLLGISTQIVMGSHAMALKKRWRTLRKLRERQEEAARGERRERQAAARRDRG